MIRLIYASKANGCISHNRISFLLRTASNNNNINNIKSMLVFNPEYFLQVIEGDKASVNLLFQRISKSKLHRQVEIIEYKEIENFECGEYDFKYATLCKNNIPLYQAYMNTNEFDPYLLKSSKAFSFIQEISKIQDFNDEYLKVS